MSRGGFVSAPLAAAIALGAVSAPAALLKATSSFGADTVSLTALAALRCRVAGAAALDDFDVDVPAAVVRAFFAGAVVLPSGRSPPAAFAAAVSRGFLEEVLFDCIRYILLITPGFCQRLCVTGSLFSRLL